MSAGYVVFFPSHRSQRQNSWEADWAAAGLPAGHMAESPTRCYSTVLSVPLLFHRSGPEERAGGRAFPEGGSQPDNRVSADCTRRRGKRGVTSQGHSSPQKVLKVQFFQQRPGCWNANPAELEFHQTPSLTDGLANSEVPKLEAAGILFPGAREGTREGTWRVCCSAPPGTPLGSGQAFKPGELPGGV